MAGLFSIFDIGKLALVANQQALQVVSQNLANINTPGYSRQEALLQQTAPNTLGNFQIGTGVQVTQIRRVVNNFVETQLNVSEQDLGRLEAQADAMNRLESVFPASDDRGINKALADFFNALRDLSSNPQGRTERTVLLSKAAALASEFKQAGGALAQIRTDLNTQISQTVRDVNSLASRIALLNSQIGAAEVGGQSANDLRDERGQLLNDLGKRIEIHTFEDATGQTQVFVGRGQTLVERDLTFGIATTPSADNGGLLNITYTGNGGDITSLIGNGALKGMLLLRDRTVPDVLDQLNQLAASLVNEVNQVHRLGFGLDGTTGADFFSPLSVAARGQAVNTGTALIESGAVTADSLLTQHEYEIRFSSATAYSIVDATTGATVKGNYSGTALTAPTAAAPVNIVTGTNDTLVLSVDGTASGTITLTGAASPGQAYNSGAALATEVQSKINADATLVAAGKSVTVLYDTSRNRFVITSTSTASSSVVDVTGGTARATLGLSAGTSTAASGTYGTPQTFTFDGISVQLSGVPAADDVFTVSTRTNAAKTLAVALTDENTIAASGTQAGIPGDNATALALVALQSRALTTLEGATLTAYYGATASAVGSVVQTNTQNLGTQEGVRNQLITIRGQTSGVSTDEELANLLQFQHAYQAAARIIIVADEMFQTLLDLKR
jgi:flagellar hook-associated protein 1 FlgK